MTQTTSSEKPPLHFDDKNVVDHLKEAKKKGIRATEEIHGLELPGHIYAATDAAKETCIALLLFWIILQHFPFLVSEMPVILLVFASGWLIWKMGRSAVLGWARLERLHRLIEEERWEIEHHRSQEKEELTAMYRAKGLSGKLLEEVIDVLMADDNRLLQVMLEEELRVPLGSFEHPLKQSIGAGIGVILASTILGLGLYFYPFFRNSNNSRIRHCYFIWSCS